MVSRRSAACAIATAIIWGLLIGMLFHFQCRNIALEATVNAYKHQFRQRIGEDDVSGPYHHITLDGGLTWWRCTLSALPDDSVAVLLGGRADQELVNRIDNRIK